MTPEELRRFNEANKIVHPVETQWHYPIMTKYGYVPVTLTGIGFVRSYEYTHPETGRSIKVSTGVNADYWEDGGAFGYWRDLEPHLQSH